MVAPAVLAPSVISLVVAGTQPLMTLCLAAVSYSMLDNTCQAMWGGQGREGRPDVPELLQHRMLKMRRRGLGFRAAKHHGQQQGCVRCGGDRESVPSVHIRLQRPPARHRSDKR